MRRPSRLAIAVLAAACAALGQVGATLATPLPTVECGQLTGYLAPDPVAPASGSVTIGTLTPWEIQPTATVSANAAASLPSILNSGPTCLALVLDAESKVTALDFAAQGTVSGHVDYDGTSGFYLFADRLIVPTFITDAYPGLAALFVTSYQAGSPLKVTFMVDVTSGAFTGFDGTAKFCGKAGATSSGVGKIGNARIPAAVLNSHNLHVLQDASGTKACATVHSVGVITLDSDGQIDVQTDVTIKVAEVAADTDDPPPDTATVAPVVPARSGSLLPLLLVALAILALTRRRASLS